MPHVRHVEIIAALEDHHQGDLGLAKRMVDAAANVGADAVKFPVDGKLDAALVEAVREHARGRVAFVGAPHDEVALTRLQKIGVDAWQLDPAMLADTPLVEKVAATGARTFAALGRTTDGEVRALVRAFARSPLELLHCVDGSAPTLADSALGLIPAYAAEHKRPVGYLALEGGVEGSIAAVALGASVIEVPFAIDPALRGRHAAPALARDELAHLTRSIRALATSLAAGPERVVAPSELDAFASERRTLVAAHDLRAGTVLTAEMLVVRANGRGLSPRLMPHVVGKRLLYDMPAESALTFGDVDL